MTPMYLNTGKTFHQTPYDNFRASLINGVVYLSSSPFGVTRTYNCETKLTLSRRDNIRLTQLICQVATSIFIIYLGVQVNKSLRSSQVASLGAGASIGLIMSISAIGVRVVRDRIISASKEHRLESFTKDCVALFCSSNQPNDLQIFNQSKDGILQSIQNLPLNELDLTSGEDQNELAIDEMLLRFQPQDQFRKGSVVLSGDPLSLICVRLFEYQSTWKCLVCPYYSGKAAILPVKSDGNYQSEDIKIFSARSDDLGNYVWQNINGRRYGTLRHTQHSFIDAPQGCYIKIFSKEEEVIVREQLLKKVREESLSDPTVQLLRPPSNQKRAVG